MTARQDDENEELGRILRRVLEDPDRSGYTWAGVLGVGGPALVVDETVALSRDELALVRKLLEAGSDG